MVERARGRNFHAFNRTFVIFKVFRRPNALSSAQKGCDSSAFRHLEIFPAIILVSRSENKDFMPSERRKR